MIVTVAMFLLRNSFGSIVYYDNWIEENGLVQAYQRYYGSKDPKTEEIHAHFYSWYHLLNRSNDHNDIKWNHPCYPAIKTSQLLRRPSDVYGTHVWPNTCALPIRDQRPPSLRQRDMPLTKWRYLRGRAYRRSTPSIRRTPTFDEGRGQVSWRHGCKMIKRTTTSNSGNDLKGVKWKMLIVCLSALFGISCPIVVSNHPRSALISTLMFIAKNLARTDTSEISNTIQRVWG